MLVFKQLFTFLKCAVPSGNSDSSGLVASDSVALSCKIYQAVHYHSKCFIAQAYWKNVCLAKVSVGCFIA